MSSRGRIRFFAVLLLLQLVALALADQQCYYPNGVKTKLEEHFVPCNGTTGASSCCMSTDSCTTSGLCLSRRGYMYRGGCTDPTFKSPECGNKCTKVQIDDWTGLWPCKNKDNKEQEDGLVFFDWCCGTVTGSCCNDAFPKDSTFDAGSAFPPQVDVTEKSNIDELSRKRALLDQMGLGLGLGLGLPLVLLLFSTVILGFNLRRARSDVKYSQELIHDYQYIMQTRMSSSFSSPTSPSSITKNPFHRSRTDPTNGVPTELYDRRLHEPTELITNPVFEMDGRIRSEHPDMTEKRRKRFSVLTGRSARNVGSEKRFVRELEVLRKLRERTTLQRLSRVYPNDRRKSSAATKDKEMQ